MHIARPGHELPEDKGYIALSIENTVTTIKTAPYLPQLFLYLGSYFIFSDGCSTMAGAAATFAANELNMSSIFIILGILFVSIMVRGCQ